MRANPAIPSRRLYLGSISGIRAIILGAAILNLATSCSTTPQSLSESRDFLTGGLVGSAIGSNKKNRPEARQPSRQPPADSPPSAPTVPKLPPQTAQQSVAPSQKRAAKPTGEEFKLREEGRILGAAEAGMIGAGVRPSSRPKKKALPENQSSGPIFTWGHTITARPEARQPNRQPPADSPPSAPAEPKLPPQTAQQSVVPSTGEATRPPQKTSKD